MKCIKHHKNQINEIKLQFLSKNTQVYCAQCKKNDEQQHPYYNFSEQFLLTRIYRYEQYFNRLLIQFMNLYNEYKFTIFKAIDSTYELIQKIKNQSSNIQLDRLLQNFNLQIEPEFIFLYDEKHLNQIFYNKFGKILKIERQKSPTINLRPDENNLRIIKKEVEQLQQIRPEKINVAQNDIFQLQKKRKNKYHEVIRQQIQEKSKTEKKNKFLKFFTDCLKNRD